jgi:hypothetical protein
MSKMDKTASFLNVLGKHVSGEVFLRPSLGSLLKGLEWAEFGMTKQKITCRYLQSRK